MDLPEQTLQKPGSSLSGEGVSDLRPPVAGQDLSRQPFRSGRIDELWGLVRVKDGGWVPAMDCTGEPLLAYCSFEEAQAGAEAHFNLYEIDCIPRRFDSEG